MNQHFGFSLSYDQYIAYEANHSGSLCNQTPYATTDADPYDCVKNQVQVLVANGIQDWNSYIAAARQAFINNYESTCSMAQENATMASVEQLYHYTLYYYDQADNLVRTIPPEGVNLVASTSFPYIDKARDADTTTVVYNGPAANSNQTAAMDTLSNILSAAHGTVEMWLYNPALAGHYKFGINTPDNAYAFQTGIGGNTLTIDIFPKAGTTEWHYQADISALQPLNPFASVVLKGDALGTGPASPGVYLNGTRLTVTRTSSAPSAVADSMQMLKHLRLYRHQLSDHSISADAAAVFFAANDPGYAGWFRFNVPTAGSITTVNDTSTREQQYYDIYPAHGLPTTYIYNATNQVTMQRSPDGGVNRYWYDLLSRLSVSQNDKQKTANYSYTLYDTLGRVNEVGQKNQTTVSLGTVGYLSAATLSSFIAAGTNSQITHTYYDTPVDTTVGHTTGIASIYTQNNLRKRVAASTYADTQTGPVLRATYYTYDIDGNVNTLWQQLDGLYTPSTNAGLKRIDYEYDLVSGKVNFVRYQTSQPDAFYYAYSYDADNRITGAVTANRVIVDTLTGSMLPPSIRKLDARYYYYLHGPLRRMELGSDGAAVQGLDYAYTLQGWLKGVNSASGASFYDMGLDSATVAKDAYGYSLGYYTGDYTPIGGTAYKAFSLQYSQTMGDITGQSLYNGNISNTTYAINQLGTPVGYTYAYDQLNRIKRMRQYAGIHGTSWSRANITQNYQENVTYDGNGNILTYGRNGVSPTTAQTIDSLTYHYTLANGKITTNKLNYITDAISSSGYNLDLRNQTSLTNYRYDAIGNLIYDNYSGITGNGGVNSITWSVYNKPLKIYKAGADSITYTYNTANQRVSKNELGVTNWYVRDAQGNVLALYDNVHGNNNWREQHLYGSSRLGMWMPNMNMVTNNSVAIWDSVGKKQYELDNHLGNVMTTVTDKRLQHSTSGTSIDYFLADVASAQDYYPGGMLMPGRIYTFGGDSTYRYGFNGKENDNTIKGLGNQIDFGNRIYDPRVVNWLSTDPLQHKYPGITPYSFAANNPINLIDAEGRDIIRFTEINHYETAHAHRFGYSYRKILSTTHFVSVIKAPGPDKFISDVINVDASAHNKIEINSIQFHPREGDFFKRSGATESYVRVFDIPTGILMNDFDDISLLKLAPESVLNYLEKHNPQKYGGLALEQETRNLKAIIPLALSVTVLWAEAPELVAGDASILVASGKGGVVMPMKIERIISKGEKMSDIINDAKAITFTTGNETAVVTLKNGQRALVSGGSGGISFEEGQIKRIFGHTHPYGSGSGSISDADQEILNQLNQTQQKVLQNGETTTVRPKNN